MIYEEIQLPELYYMKHRNDDDSEFVDYGNKVLDKTLTPYMYNNDRMNTFLGYLQKMVALFFDQNNLIKNWKNYMVHKYYYKHKN
jgi:hypothetical protein